MAALGLKVMGFGAPRNSITDHVRDLLIDARLEYDGSAAYDPMSGFLDIAYAHHSTKPGAKILVIPFIMPNDYDARFGANLSADEMLAGWKQRLDRVLENREPCFVLDIHQWSASQPDNLEAVRQFIRYAKSRPRCRLVTLQEAARQARRVDRYEAERGRPHRQLCPSVD